MVDMLNNTTNEFTFLSTFTKTCIESPKDKE